VGGTQSRYLTGHDEARLGSLAAEVWVSPVWWRSAERQTSTPGDGRRQPQHDEQVRRVEIVLAGFVDDAKVALSRRFTIRKNLIDLSLLQVLRTVVTDTESERRCRLVSSHRLVFYFGFRLRPDVALTPWDASHARRARRTCSAIGAPVLCFTCSRPSMRSRSSRKAHNFVAVIGDHCIALTIHTQRAYQAGELVGEQGAFPQHRSDYAESGLRMQKRLVASFASGA
jgi:hypothetical protein